MHVIVFALQIFLLYDSYKQHYRELHLLYTIQTTQNRCQKILQADCQTSLPNEAKVSDYFELMLDSFDVNFRKFLNFILTDITVPQHDHECDNLVGSETELHGAIDGCGEGVLQKAVDGSSDRVLACVRELEIRDVLMGAYKGKQALSPVHQVISSSCTMFSRQGVYGVTPPSRVMLLTADQGLQVRQNNLNLLSA